MVVQRQDFFCWQVDWFIFVSFARHGLYMALPYPGLARSSNRSRTNTELRPCDVLRRHTPLGLYFRENVAGQTLARRCGCFSNRSHRGCSIRSWVGFNSQQLSRGRGALVTKCATKVFRCRSRTGCKRELAVAKRGPGAGGTNRGAFGSNKLCSGDSPIQSAADPVSCGD